MDENGEYLNDGEYFREHEPVGASLHRSDDLGSKMVSSCNGRVEHGERRLAK